MIHIVIPTYERPEHLSACLSSLHGQRGGPTRIVVVDHGRKQTAADLDAARSSSCTVLRASPDLWWSGAMNVGVRRVLASASDDDRLVTLNDDVVATPGCLRMLLAAADMCGPRTLIGSLAVDASDERVVLDAGTVVNWRTGRHRHLLASQRQAGSPVEPDLHEVSVLSGRGTLIPIQAFRELGLYDEQRFPQYAADYEFARRAGRRGWRVAISHAAVVMTYAQSTGLHARQSQRPRRGFASRLSSRASAHNLACRWHYARTCADPGWWPVFLTCDVSRVVIHTARDCLWLRAIDRRGETF